MKNLFKICLLAGTCFCASCSDSDNEDYVMPIAWVDAETPYNALPDNDNTEVSSLRWKLEFSDEFNDERIDFNKWTLRHATEWNYARPQLGVAGQASNAGNVAEEDGDLVLKVTKVGTDKARYGDVYSYKKFNMKYGYIEARMKVADMRKAVMSAFWVQTTSVNNVDGTGNDVAEIDIFESAYIGEKTLSTIHFDGYGSSHKQNKIEYIAPGLPDDYHVWGLLWDESSLKMYYDGELKAEFDGIWVPQVAEYIELSTGITFSDEGDFRSQPADSHLSEAYVDYVRVWTLDK